MGKCNKVLSKKLLCEFLACFLIQIIGCTLPDLHTALFAVDPSEIPRYAKDSITGRLSKRPPSRDRNKDRDRDEFGLGIFGYAGVLHLDFGSMGGELPEGDMAHVMDHIGFTHTTVLYAFAWGGAVLIFTQAFRVVSGAHLNPVVSIASMILKNVPVFDGLMYILMQMLGSLLGHAVSWAIFVPFMLLTGIKFCATTIRYHEFYKGLLMEFFLTSTYVFAMCASWHQSNADLMESISLRIGVVVIGAIMVGAPYTMTCMNPFRSLWPAISSLYFENIWIYFFIPIIASVLMALFWRFLILQNKDETVKSQGGGGGGGE